MNFDGIDTDTIAAKEGELSQLVGMLSDSTTIDAERLEIVTESGETLRITSESGYSSIRIEGTLDSESNE